MDPIKGLYIEVRRITGFVYRLRYKTGRVHLSFVSVSVSERQKLGAIRNVTTILHAL